MSSNSSNTTFATDDPSAPSVSTFIAVITVEGLIIIVGTLGNLLVLTVVFANIRLATVSNILIANLASVDLLTTLFLIPADIYRHVCVHTGICPVCETMTTARHTLAHFIVAAASTSLLIIAVDRFISIAFPMKYTTVLTKRRAYACVVLTWFLGALITAVFNGLNIIFIQNTYCIFLILITFFLYAYILSVALKHERRIAAMQIPYQRKATIFPWERKSAQTMAIILGVYTLCWVPTVVFYSVVASDHEGRSYPRLQEWINVAYYLNAVLNPFIYCIRSQRFRKAVKKLIRS